MRGQRVFSQAQLAVGNALDKSRRAETRLAADEATAAAAWQDLERRNAQLAQLKEDIERKLDEARRQLQGQADASVAAGSCGGAARIDQPQVRGTRAWVAPVETYEMSASFGSGGERWAHRHTGQDFAVPIGTPVRSVGRGRVVRVSCGGAFGMQVVIEHPGGYYSQYGHLASVTVDQGERVSPGSGSGSPAAPATPPARICTSRYGSHRNSGRRWIRCRGWKRAGSGCDRRSRGAHVRGVCLDDAC